MPLAKWVREGSTTVEEDKRKKKGRKTNIHTGKDISETNVEGKGCCPVERRS